MTTLAVASTGKKDVDAGTDLARELLAGLGGRSPDVVLIFASAQNDYQAVLTGVRNGCWPTHLIGCSSAGEFTGASDGTGRTSAIAIQSDDMKFSSSIADLSAGDRVQAARDLLKEFKGLTSVECKYRTAFVLVDALAGHADDLIDQLTQATGGTYRLAGGGAGDDGRFSQTHVFLGTEARTSAAVALEILSNKPIGIGAKHGWSTRGDPLRVTDSKDTCVVSFNVAPAVEAFDDHAESTGQTFDHTNPLPFFLHNIVGVKTDDGHKLRVPLGVNDKGGIALAAEIPKGSSASIMWTQSADAATAAASATRDAIQQVVSEGHRPAGAVFLDCVATRLRLGDAFDDELDAVREELGETPFAGFNSYGQIVRSEGQFSGFHNCTAVVMVIPA